MNDADVNNTDIEHDESLWDTLPEDMVLELDTEVLELIDQWMYSDTILQFAKPDAYDRIVEDVALLVADACVAAEVCDADDTEAMDDIATFVRDRLHVYLSMGSVPPRSESNTSTMQDDEPTSTMQADACTSTMQDDALTSTMQDSVHTSTMQADAPTSTMRAKIQSTIEYLKGVPQPVQRTREWYEFRHGLMTASNVYKALSGSEAQCNSLIYEKCLPMKTDGDHRCHDQREMNTDDQREISTGEDNCNWSEGFQPSTTKSYEREALGGFWGTTTNTNSPMHWGQKYEPVTQQLYMKHTNTTVEEFGCIRHRTYPFLGASPDGIVTSVKQQLRSTQHMVGRMVEIKNIVNREITGVPLEAYWVQMQLQMEVCDLDECDFVETRICEYPDALHPDAFYEDTNRTRGVILYLLSRTQIGSTPHYVYMPLDMPLDRPAVVAWIARTREAHAAEYTWFQTLYWYLDEMSIVLVRRNRRWFDAALPILARTWRTIEHERVHGYEHRAPKRREPAAAAAAHGSGPGPSLGRGLCVIKLDHNVDGL